MILVVPPPRPPANLGALSDVELVAMEGMERRHLEARIRVLRDIQTLLDAAVLQMNQYGVLVSRLEHESNNNNNNTNNNIVINETIPVEPTVAAAQPAEDVALLEDDPVAEDLTTEEETNLSDQERLRRRRLQRFMNGVEQI